jgi:hypothetical protein
MFVSQGMACPVLLTEHLLGRIAYREFEVESLNFPGQAHRWRLTQLLQKGTVRAHESLLDVGFGWSFFPSLLTWVLPTGQRPSHASASDHCTQPLSFPLLQLVASSQKSLSSSVANLGCVAMRQAQKLCSLSFFKCRYFDWNAVCHSWRYHWEAVCRAHKISCGRIELTGQILYR